MKAFLAASAEGFRYAAAHPAEAAKLFVQAANAAHPDLAQPLEEGWCAESLEYVAPVSGGGRLGWLGVYGCLAACLASWPVASRSGLGCNPAGHRLSWRHRIRPPTCAAPAGGRWAVGRDGGAALGRLPGLAVG